MKNTFKKVAALGLIASMVMAPLAACTNDKDKGKDDNKKDPNVVAEQTFAVELETQQGRMGEVLAWKEDDYSFNFTTTEKTEYIIYVKSSVNETAYADPAPVEGMAYPEIGESGTDETKGAWTVFKDFAAETEYKVTLSPDFETDYTALGKAAGDKITYNVIIEFHESQGEVNPPPVDTGKVLLLNGSKDVEVTLVEQEGRMGKTVTWELEDSVIAEFTATDAGTYRFYVKTAVGDLAEIAITPVESETYPEMKEFGSDETKGDWVDYKLAADTKYKVELMAESMVDYATYQKDGVALKAGDKITYVISVEFIPAAA